MQKIFIFLFSFFLIFSGCTPLQTKNIPSQEKAQIIPKNSAQEIFDTLPSSSFFLEIQSTPDLEQSVEMITDGLAQFLEKRGMLTSEMQFALSGGKEVALMNMRSFRYVRFFSKIPQSITPEESRDLWKNTHDDALTAQFFQEKEICLLVEISAENPVIESFFENIANEESAFFTTQNLKTSSLLTSSACLEDDIDFVTHFKGKDNFSLGMDVEGMKKNGENFFRAFFEQVFEEISDPDLDSVRGILQDLASEMSTIRYVQIWKSIEKMAIVAVIRQKEFEISKISSFSQLQDANDIADYWDASARKKKIFLPDDVIFTFDTRQDKKIVKHYEHMKNISLSFFLGQYLKMYGDAGIAPIVIMGILATGAVTVYNESMEKARAVSEGE